MERETLLMILLSGSTTSGKWPFHPLSICAWPP